MKNIIKFLNVGVLSVLISALVLSSPSHAWVGDLDYYQGSWDYAQAYEDLMSTPLSGSYMIVADLANDPIVSVRIYQSANNIVFDGVDDNEVLVRSINSSTGINIIYCDNDTSHNQGSGLIVCYDDETRTESFVDELNQWDQVVAVSGATFTQSYGNGSHYDD